MTPPRGYLHNDQSSGVLLMNDLKTFSASAGLSLAAD